MERSIIRRITALVVVIAILGLVAGCSQSNPPPAGSASSKSLTVKSGEAVKLSSTPSGIYQPEEIYVKAGSTVRIEGDPATLKGTMDTIIIDGYDVSKKVSAGDNVLEFVADKPGEFSMHCANGMGYGKLIVTP